MADVDKAITFEDQVELGVRDRSKEMEVEVDIKEENVDLEGFEEMDDGSIMFGAPTPPMEDTNFYSNLAENLDSSELTSVVNDLMGNIDSDKESRSDWEKTYKEDLNT